MDSWRKITKRTNIYKNVEAITSIDKISTKYKELYDNPIEEENIYNIHETKLLS